MTSGSAFFYENIVPENSREGQTCRRYIVHVFCDYTVSSSCLVRYFIEYVYEVIPFVHHGNNLITFKLRLHDMLL